jgi:hypothetical protein
MGLNFTYDSPCWSVYRFDSQKERELWMKDHEYCDNKWVAQVATRKEAEKVRKYFTPVYWNELEKDFCPGEQEDFKPE